MLVLNAAVQKLKLWPTDWYFDLVLSQGVIQEWIEEHPQVVKLIRDLGIPNPGRDLSEDRAEMRALGAARKRDEFTAGPTDALKTRTEEFARLLVGVETGDTKVRLESRSGHGKVRSVFRSDEHADYIYVADFHDDLQAGMELALEALRDYVDEAFGRRPGKTVGA